MRVGLDAQLARGTATGIGEYVRGLGTSLRAAGVDVVTLESQRFDPWRFDRRVAWDQVLLPIAAARARVDLLHCASGTVPLVRAMPIVVTVHDVAWLRAQAHARPYARAYFGAFAIARYARARRIVVDSVFSRDELQSLAHVAPENVAVVYPGVASDVMAVRRARDDDAPYLLAVGTVEARKNLAVLVRALARLPTLRLVAVGPPTPYLQTCLALARELGVTSRFEVRGYVPRRDLLALYAGALACAVPSYYEGFGYGVAQALCAGVPTIAARTSSLPEVADGDARLVAPDDVADWIRAIAEVADDRARAQHRADAARPRACERFGWTAAASAIARVYEAALANDRAD
ncbi:MAG: glycosyltransferase family 1 protein [Vulcanimicrobiaceae bacterium]